MLEIIERLRGIARRHRDLRDLSALSDLDLSDLGVSRDQAVALAALPDDVAGRVTAMGRVFGVDEAHLHANRAAWIDMLENCAHCGALPACRHFMASPDGSAAEAARFCPNAAEFADVRQRDA
ncbi:MAG: hypothetical protein Kow0013_07590 [Pararhodobacter sp.]